MPSSKFLKSDWFVFCAAIAVAVVVLAFGALLRIDGRADDLSDEKSAVIVSDYQGLLPHRAVYSVKTDSIKDTSVIVNVSGKLSYEWRLDCGGAMTDYQFDMRYDYNGTPSVDMQTHIGNYETHDGEMSFFIQRKANGELEDYIKGHVSLADGKAYYVAPEEFEVSLPKGVVFPSMHVSGLVEAIRAGQRIYFSSLFDGSEGNGLLDVNAIILGEHDPSQGLDKQNDQLDMAAFLSPAHDVHLAFYDTAVGADQEKEGLDVPAYEMKAIFHENGVMRNVYIDYDSFVVLQQLESIEILDSACQ